MKFFDLILLALMMCACSEKAQTDDSNTSGKISLPLPTAYPRPNFPDTVLYTPDSLPLRFDVNASAVMSSPRPGWVDIAYPTLGATVHLTFSEVGKANIASAKDNRMQRLMLNAGDHIIDLKEFTNAAGFDVIIAKGEGSITPLQILATDNRNWLVSGAVYFSDPRAVTTTDSLLPYINYIENDLIRGVTSLNYK